MATELMTTGRRGRPKGTVVGLAIDLAKRQAVVDLLTANPKLTNSEIAHATGVSRGTIRSIRVELDTADGETTEQYGRQLAKRLPMSKRLAVWNDLVTGKLQGADAHAVRAALIRVEELIGHVTKKEQRDAEANSSAPGPIFVFPVGMVPSAAPVTPHVVVEADKQVLPASVTLPDPDKSGT